MPTCPECGYSGLEFTEWIASLTETETGDHEADAPVVVCPVCESNLGPMESISDTE